MTRRFFGLGLALVFACSALVGCELLHHEVRAKPEAPAPEPESDAAKAAGVTSEAPKGFFKSTRLPGAMSDEGRDIERNLGIH